MTKASVSQWSSTAADNTDIGGITLNGNVMRPRDVDNAFRELMAQVKAAFTVDTLADAQALAPTVAPAFIRTAGYSEPGDGGGALYKKVASEPSHEGKFSITLAGGSVVWFELAETVPNPLMFGAVEGGVTDCAAAFQDALAFAGAIGCDVFVPAGAYLCTETLVVPDGVKLIGSGNGYEFDTRTKLLFSGTGAKSYSISGATATTVANPDAGAAYLADSGTRGDSYSTLDLSVDFSAAIILGKGSGLKGLGVFPDFDGVDGYSGTDGNLSDEWDVGVWARNSDWWTIEECNVIGHWRKSALLVSAHDLGDGAVPSNELGHASRSHFQGFRGISIRSPETIAGSNYGFAGTDFINCLVRGLWHQSGHLATSSQLSTPFSSPSGPLEISGDVMRGVQFLNCTFIGRDDMLAFFGQCSEILFSGCYEESKQIKVSGSTLANSLGSRMVATSDAADVVFMGNSQYGIDFSSHQTRDSSLTGQRYTAAGLFTPSTGYDDDYVVRRFGSYLGHRFRKSTDRFIYSDESDTSKIILDAAGRIQAALLFSGTITIADDAVGSITPPKVGGTVAITYCGSTENGNFPDTTRSGVVGFDTGSSVAATKYGGGASFTVVSTDVTGTTGTDGQVTVGVAAGAIKIENRSGASAVFRYTFLG